MVFLFWTMRLVLRRFCYRCCCGYIRTLFCPLFVYSLLRDVAFNSLLRGSMLVYELA